MVYFHFFITHRAFKNFHRGLHPISGHIPLWVVYFFGHGVHCDEVDVFQGLVGRCLGKLCFFFIVFIVVVDNFGGEDTFACLHLAERKLVICFRIYERVMLRIIHEMRMLGLIILDCYRLVLRVDVYFEIYLNRLPCSTDLRMHRILSSIFNHGLINFT